MLTKASIRNSTNSTTYSRGLDIYHSSGIREFNVEEDDFDDIRARVKGSGRNKYEVSILYNNREDDIEDSYCECPAFSSYSGICKHCVAVLLEYIDYKVRQKAIAQFTTRQQEAIATLATMKGLQQKSRLQQ